MVKKKIRNGLYMRKSKFKVEIGFNKEKILNEKIYDYDKLKAVVDEAFNKLGITGTYIDENTVIYQGVGESDNFGNYWCVLGAIERVDWILDNINKLLWYNECSPNIEEHHVDDILQEIECERTEKGGKKSAKQ